MMRGRASDTGRAILFCYSVANLSLLPFWILAFGRIGMPLDRKWDQHYYELAQVFDYVDYGAAVTLSLVLTGLLFAALRGLGAVSGRAGQVAEILMGSVGLAVLAAAILVVADPPSGNMRLTHGWIWVVLAVIGGVALVIVGGIVFLRGATLRVIRAAILCGAPIGVIMAANAFAAYAKSAPADGGLFAVDRSLAPVQGGANTKKTRVVLILFDMWDQRLTFEDRLPDLEMPEVDRFRAGAFYASKAERAGAGTLFAIPGILTGRKVMYAWQSERDDLQLVFAEQTYGQPWSKHPGVFADARQNGYTTAVVATAYHPFCRLFRRYISYCWIDDTHFDYSYKTVVTQMGYVIAEVVRMLPFVRDLFFEPRMRFSEEWGLHLYLSFRERAEALAADPRFDFLFVHWYVPHPPYVYDYKTNALVYDASFSDDYYWGNLEALDIAVGGVRRAMESAGVWDDSYIILTSDHGFTLGSWPEVVPPEKMDPRVPLLVKFPGQRQTYVYDERFLMVSLRAVLQGMFSGKLTRPEQMKDYLTYPVYYH